MAAEFDPKRRQYSRQTVAIPPGSTVRDCNFAQLTPGTAAILCDGPATFVECNLWNCQIDPRWTLDTCQTGQGWLVERSTATPEYSPAEVERLRVMAEVLTEAEWAKVEPDLLAPAETVRESQFICSHPTLLPANLQAPLGAVTEA